MPPAPRGHGSVSYGKYEGSPGYLLAELPLDPASALRERQGPPFLELARNAVTRTAEAAQETRPAIEISE